ncbi:MAG: heme-binding protein [Bacteroidota bacterium]
MKKIVLVLSLLSVVGIIFLFVAMSGSSQLETYPYEVEESFESFEIRRYEASLFTAVTLSTNEYKAASNKGFSVLAGYIFGGNQRNEQIAMTTPVSMTIDDSMTMMFMVPKEFDKSSLPKPNQSQIEFREESAKRVAAIRFGGWVNDQKLAKYKANLVDALEAEGISHTNRFMFLGYNPPYDIFNRRNEVIVEL